MHANKKEVNPSEEPKQTKNAYENICRVCMRYDALLRPIVDTIVPDVRPHFCNAFYQWRAFKQMLKIGDNTKQTSNKICPTCLNEIHRTYLFVEKCERAEIMFETLNLASASLRHLHSFFQYTHNPESILSQLVTIEKRIETDYEEPGNDVSRYAPYCTKNKTVHRLREHCESLRKSHKCNPSLSSNTPVANDNMNNDSNESNQIDDQNCLLSSLVAGNLSSTSEQLDEKANAKAGKMGEMPGSLFRSPNQRTYTNCKQKALDLISLPTGCNTLEEMIAQDLTEALDAMRKAKLSSKALNNSPAVVEADLKYMHSRSRENENASSSSHTGGKQMLSEGTQTTKRTKTSHTKGKVDDQCNSKLKEQNKPKYGRPLYYCDGCGMMFAHSKYLRAHKRTFLCEICRKTFCTANLLLIHSSQCQADSSSASLKAKSTADAAKVEEDKVG